MLKDWLEDENDCKNILFKSFMRKNNFMWLASKENMATNQYLCII